MTAIQIIFFSYIIFSAIRSRIKADPVSIMDKIINVIPIIALIIEAILAFFQGLLIYKVYVADNYAHTMDSFLTLGMLSLIQVIFAFSFITIVKNDMEIAAIRDDEE